MNMVISHVEGVFILEYHFAANSFAAVSEVFSSVYPDKVVPKKKTIHRLVTKFRNTGSVCDKRSSSNKTLKLWPCRCQAAHQLKQRARSARMKYCRWFRHFMPEGVYVYDEVRK
jgi:hypothetical protein